MSVPNETQRRLYRWGHWAGGGIPGFPMMSAIMRINCGGRSTAMIEADPELIRTDHIIGRAALPMRKILIRHYCTNGSGREKALRMGLPKSTYWERLEEARWFVHVEYDKPDLVAADRKCYQSVSVRIAVTQPHT